MSEKSYRSSSQGRRRTVLQTTSRAGGTLIVAAGLTLLPAAAAMAEEEEGESSRASVLVQQAQALLVNGNSPEAVSDKLNNALAAPDASRADLTVVRTIAPQVGRARLTEDRRTQLATALQAALTDDGSPSMATGAETGTSVVLPELRPARGISDGGDGVLVAFAATSMLGGAALAYRWRPLPFAATQSLDRIRS